MRPPEKSRVRRGEDEWQNLGDYRNMLVGTQRKIIQETGKLQSETQVETTDT